jgi:hsp70-interacting protein
MSAPNWLGLLRWTIAHTDGTHDSQFNEMKEEDKLWLERVMKEVVRDDPQRMNEVMLALKDVLSRLEDGARLSEDEFETMETDLEDLRDIVEQVDMAQVFAKFHGAAILIQVANTLAFPAEVRALSLGVIATVAQNNMITQDLFFEQRLVQDLVKSFLSTDNFLVATKALLAISAVTRGHAAAEELFVKDFAALVIPRALDSRYANLVNRLLFFCNALICSDFSTTSRIEKLVGLLLPGLIEYITSEISIDVRDNLLTLLYSLLHTEAAWNAMHGSATAVTADNAGSISAENVSSSGYKDMFLQALADREQTLQSVSEEELSAEDKTLEVSKIEGLKLALHELNVLYPVSNHQATLNTVIGDGGGSSAGNPEPSAEEDESQQPQPMLMIAPPDLKGASNMP